MDFASAGASPDAGDVAFPSALTGPGERSSSTRSNPSGRNRASNRAPAPRLSANEDVAAPSSWTSSDPSLEPKPRRKVRRFLKSVVGEVRLEHVPLANLLLDPSNPRRHSRQQIRAIARSIKTFGWLIPILVDAYNRIIAGHGCYEAGRLLGLESVPVIRAEHLTPEQAKTFMLADNRLAEGSEWDVKLATVLKDLSKIDLAFDIEATGFQMAEVDLLIQKLEPPEEQSDAADEFEFAEGPPVSRIGDPWTLGDHRLFCGDALSSTSYAALLAEERAGAVFSDPPYNVRVKGHAGGKGARKHREFAMATGEMSHSEFARFLQDVFSLTAAHSLEWATFFVCMDWRHIPEIDIAIRQIGYQILNVCVWVKTNGGMGSLYRSQHELVFVFGKPGAERINNVQLGKFGRNRTNVWNYPGMNSFTRKGRTRGLDYHPTVKPIAMVADAILDVTRRGDIVLDPFCGSGTTILAAERTGRRAYAIELDPQYVDTAIERWQRMTGKTAIHASGKTFDEIRSERAAGATAEDAER